DNAFVCKVGGLGDSYMTGSWTISDKSRMDGIAHIDVPNHTVKHINKSNKNYEGLAGEADGVSIYQTVRFLRHARSDPVVTSPS
ncbi:hypothetical protein OFC49_38325, partial [Escherichia coli]|nr:hypothetical protein [Escherichia coli]